MALFATLSRLPPSETVRVALLGVVCATGLELIGAVLHTAAFNGPMAMVGLYLLNAAMVLGFALFTWFRMAKVAPIIST
jgi:hypothetical protein